MVVAGMFVDMACPVIMVVVVLMVMAMAMAVMVSVIVGMEMKDIPATDALDQHQQTDHQDQDAGDQAQVAVQGVVAQGHPVGSDLGGDGKQDDTEGMGQGYHQAQEEGIHFSALGSHQVGCHNCLAVARFQGMHAAEHNGRQVIDDVDLHEKGPLV